MSFPYYTKYEYKSYDEYISAQLSHELTKDRTKSRPFLQYIEEIKNNFSNAKKIICVGARDISEVNALRIAGYDAIGIDLFSSNHDVIKILDMHNLEENFEENEFDIVYACHSLEHSYDPEKVLNGFKKISKIGAFIVLPFLKNEHLKDPISFRFMKEYNANLESMISLIEEDFEKLGCTCKVTDLKINPLQNNVDGYWISLYWK